MQNAVELTKLREDMIPYFEGEKLIFLTTSDADDGTPSINAISWVKQIDDSHIRFSVSSNSQIAKNLAMHARVSLCFIGLESIYAIVGTCMILQEKMSGVPIRLSKIEMEIEKIEERMFFGSKIVQEPEFAKTTNPVKAKELDDKVFAALII